MVQGSMIEAEIDAPDVVEIPKRRKTVEIVVRISLINRGEEDFVAHAQNPDDAHFWHIFDESFHEVLREPGRGKGGHGGVRVVNGVHSYRTLTVAAGNGTHDQMVLELDARKLRSGHTYTIRAEIMGHLAETTFIAVAAMEALRPRRKRKAAPKKSPAAKAKKVR